MTAQPAIADVISYLAATGWVRQPGHWRGASSWLHEGDHEVLVPARDGMGDGERRMREILRVLAAVEGRPVEAVATDVGSPMADVQWYRTAAAGEVNGTAGLTTTLTALNGVHDVLGAAARAAFSGPHTVFEGAYPGPVRRLLDAARVSAPGPAGQPLTVRLPLDAGPGEEPLARRTLLLLSEASARLRDATREAARTGDLAAFDETVALGVSANLCNALTRFAGPDRTEPFELGFRWARGLPARVPPVSVAFDSGTGALLSKVGHRFRRLRFTGDAAVTGRIGQLHDDGAHDRFRVLVRGEVVMEGEPEGDRRVLWVRLPDQATYDRALVAHRDGTRVAAQGRLATVNGRLELIVTTGTFSHPH